jgi:hypothetical protein
MRTGRLAISRGHQFVHGSEEAVALMTLVPAPPRTEPLALHEPAVEAAPVPSSPEPLPDHALIDHRLTALERLTRLLEHGVLSAEEFADEKALILGRYGRRASAEGPVAFLPAAPRPDRVRPRGRSLLGRLFGGWRAIPVGLTVGLALSFATQPVATYRVFDELLRLFGV